MLVNLFFASSGAVSYIRLNDASFLYATSHAISQLRGYYYECYRSFVYITYTWNCCASLCHLVSCSEYRDSEEIDKTSHQ